MLSHHGRSLDRGFRFSFDDEAIKLSAINIETASETLRTMRVSVQSARSKIDSNRSSKTGSGFKIRTRVSTENTGNCSFESRNPAFPALAAVVNAPRPASAAVQEMR